MKSDKKQGGTQETWVEKFLHYVMLVLVGIATIAAVAAWYWRNDFLAAVSKERTYADPSAYLGQLGDYFGGLLNPVFALLALMALMLSLYVQRLELKYTREELRNSGNALEGQRLALERQAFEGTFFNVLRLHTDWIERLQIVRSAGERYDGAAVFGHIVSTMRSVALTESSTDHSKLSAGYSSAMSRNIADYEAFLGPYFRSLVLLYKLIQQAPHQYLYASVVRETLSREQLLIVLYYGLHENGLALKSLLEQFSAFENVTTDVVSNHSEAVNKYHRNAFGETKLLAR